MTINRNERGAGLGTSGESAKASKPLARKLREVITDLAREAGPRGITINEAERQIHDHKANSISPRFSELERKGVLLRIFVGYGRPTKCSPKGIPRYRTWFDEKTRRNVNVYWVPKFAPIKAQACDAPHCHPPEKPKPQSVRRESRKRKGGPA